MNAVVFGNGRSGKAAAELLRREGARVTVLEGDDVFPADGADLCVTSPGVALSHPWQAAARAAGVRVISELQLGAERFRARGGRMLAVTGSKGKSSVVKLVASALGGTPCGNYGTPLCEVVNGLAPDAAPGWAVVEVSSFQMETTDLPCGTFVAAAVLNLQEDHLDRHGDVKTYHALKRRLLAMATTCVDGAPRPVRAEEDALFAGSYFDNPVLADNARCAIALLRAAFAAEGVSEPVSNVRLAEAFAAFAPLPHRMATVREVGGVVWIDDSKATSLAALAAGVTMAKSRLSHVSNAKNAVMRRRIRLIAGGLAKGDDPASVIICLQKWVEKVYLIGSCAHQLFDAWDGIVPCERCETLENAVKAARRDACEGDIVLLSPGTASFDQFKNYGERGDAFAKLVKEEKR